MTKSELKETIKYVALTSGNSSDKSHTLDVLLSEFDKSMNNDLNDLVDRTIGEFLHVGKKISAIKFYRWVSGLGLTDCKAYVDRFSV